MLLSMGWVSRWYGKEGEGKERRGKEGGRIDTSCEDCVADTIQDCVADVYHTSGWDVTFED